MNKLLEILAEKSFMLCAIFSAFLTVLIFGFMVILGLPLIRGGQLFPMLTGEWAPYHLMYGISPMIAGTLMIAMLSVLFSFPLSMGCSAFISVLGPRGFSRFLRNVVRLMTGVPTVIYGFVGIFLLVPLIREIFREGSGMCVLSASLMLSVLISPTMILFFTSSFDQTPQSYLNAADALGGTPVQKLLYVILPHSRGGITAGVLLATGRALGDTLIALMIAGNAVQTPSSLLDSARTLTAHIALIIASDYESLEFKSVFVCGMVVYIFTTVIVLASRFSGTRKDKR